MRFLRILSAAILLSIGTFGTAAHAVTCDVNIERAYSEAAKNGWFFRCMKGVLHFDNSKRPGCISKPILPTAWEEARFFQIQSPPDKRRNGFLKNGWFIKSYQVTGGQYEKKASTAYIRMKFTFSTKAGSYHKRHLSKLILENKNGSCANALSEAFE